MFAILLLFVWNRFQLARVGRNRGCCRGATDCSCFLISFETHWLFQYYVLNILGCVQLVCGFFFCSSMVLFAGMFRERKPARRFSHILISLPLTRR
ncbi:hypothetical protein Csa_018701 [Cucumis sativus]|uniref:Uncharacterized protein n=1 Tax=Cucumis sativus TaxID=3659 RepID=A0A0A0LNJ9_CUCSA|nr:hypothetical protein Csa_018701 [Cucumis sativus]